MFELLSGVIIGWTACLVVVIAAMRHEDTVAARRRHEEFRASWESIKAMYGEPLHGPGFGDDQ